MQTISVQHRCAEADRETLTAWRCAYGAAVRIAGGKVADAALLRRL